VVNQMDFVKEKKQISGNQSAPLSTAFPLGMSTYNQLTEKATSI